MRQRRTRSPKTRSSTPGETISDSLYFLMPRVLAATLGWRVHFTFRVSKRWPWHGAWDYVAATFVPTPAVVEEL